MSMEKLLLDLALLILAAKLLGIATHRIGLSSLIGEILAGIVLGPVLFLMEPNHSLEFFSTLGLIVLLFLIGLETKYEDIKKDVYVGSFLAVGGSILSFLGGLLVGVLFFNFDMALFIGVAMVSTSTAIPIKILIDRGMFKSRVGQIMTIMAVADDTVAILALALLTSYFASGGFSIWVSASLFLAVIGFYFIILTAGTKFIGRIIDSLSMFKDEYVYISIPLAIIFFVAFFSEHIGVAAVTGAFLAGMAMATSKHAEEAIGPKFKTIGYGFLTPIFFAFSGLFISIEAIINYWPLILLLVAVGALTKAIGSGFMARFFGFDLSEQSIIAVGMVPRGEYGIVISQIALSLGVIDTRLYTILLSFVVVTVLITPILFKMQFSYFSKGRRFRK